jgi:hypothetical protein
MAGTTQLAPLRFLNRPSEAYELEPDSAWHPISMHGSMVCYKAGKVGQVEAYPM